ncbi:MAG: hypothetical protein NTX79_02875 [Candidatus Micrarchaeota archaeon]|nr:hypothetical protein [Candidatus Micrarchaeota archaeon]
MKLVLYVDGSEVSGKARSFLKAEQFMFEEVNVKTPAGASRLLKRTYQQGVPALEIARSHSVGVLTDFDEEHWRNHLRSLLPRK